MLYDILTGLSSVQNRFQRFQIRAGQTYPPVFGGGGAPLVRNVRNVRNAGNIDGSRNTFAT